ncbi:MAG: hypothetical protein ACFE0R_09310 [Salinarimonas sp.]
MNLFHETGPGQAESIIASRTISSITKPYPAEFLTRFDHPGFYLMGGFKGRGVVLTFKWRGEILDIPEILAGQCKANILYNIYFSADFVDGKWKGNRYWCSRLYPVTQNGLILVDVNRRNKRFAEGDYSAIHHTDMISNDKLKLLKRRIGTGLQVQAVDKAPLYEIYPGPERSLLQRLLDRSK